MSDRVPPLRLRTANSAPVRAERAYVLYWMTAQRRLSDNFALDRSIELAREFGKPLVVFEALRLDYPWASQRLHRFVIEGMLAQRTAASRSPVTYHPYVERRPGEARGLLAALAENAVVVVTDDYPVFFLPRMLARAAELLDVRLEAVDSNGLLPLAAAAQAHPSAYSFRRHLQKSLRQHLLAMPRPRPLARLELPRLGTELESTFRRWPAAELDGDLEWLEKLPIDQRVRATPHTGGADAAKQTLASFLRSGLPLYASKRSEPALEVSSGLSPYLHFGHISTHAIVRKIFDREGWDPSRLADRHDGQKAGWWGLSENAESFLDELITWRELGFNFAHHRTDYDDWASLPAWATSTLEAHATDPRPWIYELDALDASRTHDPIWNAAQRQLREDGRMHNYLRMLWGKKILEWSAHPKLALAHMVELNNRYALDGRDPNSYSGIFWTLGRYDRPWGPERPIFGTVRYMSSDNTRRKFDLAPYLARWSEPAPQLGLSL